MTGAGETIDALTVAVKKDIESKSQADYDDIYFVALIEKIKENAKINYHVHTLEHEGEHVLSDLTNRLAQQSMDLDTYFKVRETTREKFIEEEVNPVAKKRLERGLILDEIVRKENIQLDNDLLDVEFNNTLNSLAQQGMDFNKISGGKKGQKQFSEVIAMESASRVMTRRALDMLKTIATGEYRPAETAASADTARAEVDVDEEKPKTEKESEETSTESELSESVPSATEEKDE
jgi:FKBP-type peptidyl-prolyl cis-trans isomerase (trigger factor)